MSRAKKPTNTAARHSSKTDDWQTPPNIVEATRKTLGEIDLDPASNSIANKTVKAARFFGPGSSVDNGIREDWAGKVFLNPPGGKCDRWGIRVTKLENRKGYFYDNGDPCEGPSCSAANLWWGRLSRAWDMGVVEAAVFLAFSVELLQTTQVDNGDGEMVPLDFPICFPSTRVAFLDPSGKPFRGNTHASAIVLLPTVGEGGLEMIDRFVRQFSPIGRVVNVPWLDKRRNATSLP